MDHCAVNCPVQRNLISHAHHAFSCLSLPQRWEGAVTRKRLLLLPRQWQPRAKEGCCSFPSGDVRLSIRSRVRKGKRVQWSRHRCCVLRQPGASRLVQVRSASEDTRWMRGLRSPSRRPFPCSLTAAGSPSLLWKPHQAFDAEKPHRVSPVDREPSSSNRATVWHQDLVTREPRRTGSLRGVKACVQPITQRLSTRTRSIWGRLTEGLPVAIAQSREGLFFGVSQLNLPFSKLDEPAGLPYVSVALGYLASLILRVGCVFCCRRSSLRVASEGLDAHCLRNETDFESQSFSLTPEDCDLRPSTQVPGLGAKVAEYNFRSIRELSALKPGSTPTCSRTHHHPQQPPRSGRGG